MTNREKYKEEILDIACKGESFAFNKDTRKIVRCEGISCRECEFHISDDINCKPQVNHWCNSEYKELEIDWSKVEVDTPILVRNFVDREWLNRYFAKYENSKVYAWNNGRSSWSALSEDDTSSWEFAKLAESEE